MSETPDAIPTELGEDEVSVVGAAPKPARSRTSGRRSGGRASGAGRRSSGPRAGRSPRAEAPPADAAGSLAEALRGLVSGIDEEVAAISALSEEIDHHVQALNDLRSQATVRLLHLDELRAVAEDVNLSAFLDTSIAPQLPQVEEEFPDRIYGG